MAKDRLRRLLLNQVNKETVTGCWEFLGPKTAEGHGRVWIEGKEQKAHRAFYEEWVGPIPSGNFLHQHLPEGKCIGKLCCNPKHMMLSSLSRLPKRAVEKTTPSPAPTAPVKTCSKGHQLTDDNVVIENRQGKQVRRCRTCRRKDWRDWVYARRRKYVND